LRHPAWRKHPDPWQAARDELLRALHDRGQLSEVGLQSALARPVPVSAESAAPPTPR
jgi:hypothetical protein